MGDLRESPAIAVIERLQETCPGRLLADGFAGGALDGIESARAGRCDELAACPPAHSLRGVGLPALRRNRWLYVDKTGFLRRLEQERYVFLIRPRRFGKSLWVSLLENYYDRFWSGRFEATFAGTDVGRDPTGEQSRYVVLRFDFSAVNDTLETLEREFETYCNIELRGALRRHPDLFPEAALRDILAPPSIANKLAELVPLRGRSRHPAVRADRRVRQLRQHRAGASRRRGVQRLHPRRGLLPHQVFNVIEERDGHFHWPDLDVDLDIDRIQHPERYPLVAKVDR